MILMSKQHAKHPFSGQNTQQTLLVTLLKILFQVMSDIVLFWEKIVTMNGICKDNFPIRKLWLKKIVNCK